MQLIKKDVEEKVEWYMIVEKSGIIILVQM